MGCVRWFAVAVVLTWAGAAPACPLCDSDTGRQVRAGIFGADFGPNLAAVLLPFPILFALVALVRRAVPAPEERP